MFENVNPGAVQQNKDGDNNNEQHEVDNNNVLEESEVNNINMDIAQEDLVSSKIQTIVESIQMNAQQAAERSSKRSNFGKGVNRLELLMEEKTHNEVKEVQGPGHKANLYAFQFIQRTRRKKRKDKIDTMIRILDVMFTQMPATEGFRLFGERAVVAIFNEFV